MLQALGESCPHIPPEVLAAGSVHATKINKGKDGWGRFGDGELSTERESARNAFHCCLVLLVYNHALPIMLSSAATPRGGGRCLHCAKFPDSCAPACVNVVLRASFMRVYACVACVPADLARALPVSSGVCPPQAQPRLRMGAARRREARAPHGRAGPQGEKGHHTTTFVQSDVKKGGVIQECK